MPTGDKYDRSHAIPFWSRPGRMILRNAIASRVGCTLWQQVHILLWIVIFCNHNMNVDMPTVCVHKGARLHLKGRDAVISQMKLIFHLAPVLRFIWAKTVSTSAMWRSCSFWNLKRKFGFIPFSIQGKPLKNVLTSLYSVECREYLPFFRLAWCWRRILTRASSASFDAFEYAARRASTVGLEATEMRKKKIAQRLPKRNTRTLVLVSSEYVHRPVEVWHPVSWHRIRRLQRASNSTRSKKAIHTSQSVDTHSH